MVGQQHVNLESMCKDGLRSKLNLCEQIFKSKLNTFIKSTFWSFFNFNWIHMNPQIWQNPIHNPNLPTSSNIIQHPKIFSAFRSSLCGFHGRLLPLRILRRRWCLCRSMIPPSLNHTSMDWSNLINWNIYRKPWVFSPNMPEIHWESISLNNQLCI